MVKAWPWLFEIHLNKYGGDTGIQEKQTNKQTNKKLTKHTTNNAFHTCSCNL